MVFFSTALIQEPLQNILLPFLALIASLLVSVNCKYFFHKIKFRHKKEAPHSLYAAFVYEGGMPSTHSTLVASTVSIVFFESGFSLLFFVTVIFSLIILRDAVGVRWEVSRHSLYLNSLSLYLNSLRSEKRATDTSINKKSVDTKQFKIVGHKPLEVLGGLLVGFIVTVLLYSIK